MPYFVQAERSEDHSALSRADRKYPSAMAAPNQRLILLSVQK
jgi:hypothetical protein